MESETSLASLIERVGRAEATTQSPEIRYQLRIWHHVTCAGFGGKACTCLAQREKLIAELAAGESSVNRPEGKGMKEVETCIHEIPQELMLSMGEFLEAAHGVIAEGPTELHIGAALARFYGRGVSAALRASRI